MAHQYVIDYTTLGVPVDNLMVLSPLILDTLTQYALEHIVDIRPGDLMRHEHSDYRNESVCIWTGDKFIDLESDVILDDYGYVPRLFEVDDEHFAPTWWSAIAHNNLFWFHPSIFERLNFQLCEDEHKDLLFGEPRTVVRSELILNGRVYNVFADGAILGRIIHPVFYYDDEFGTTLIMTDAQTAGSHAYTFT